MPIENYRLENKSFIKIKTITEQIGKLQKFFPQFAENFPTLLDEIKDLEFRKEIIDKVDKVFNRFGEVKSEASTILKTLRTKSNARKAIDENNRSLATYSDFWKISEKVLLKINVF
jgi:DNA mismatch repair protein MutS2